MSNIPGMQGVKELGKYRIVKELGRGSFGAVYFAEDTTLSDRPVALKVLYPQLVVDPDTVGLFRQEASTAAHLDHPNIANVYEAGDFESMRFIAMRYVPGQTLAHVIDEEGPQPLAQVAKWLAQIGSALDYAHEQGILHRDIKPGNILLDRDGRAVVTDFGLAKAVSASGGTVTSQDREIMSGTAKYMAPEQAKGKPIRQSDLYSLGVVLYELLTGQVPFDGDDPFAIAIQHMTEDPVPPCELRPDLPEPIDMVVLRAMAKQPADRFSTAGEMAHAFQLVLGAGAQARLKAAEKPLHRVVEERTRLEERKRQVVQASERLVRRDRTSRHAKEAIQATKDTRSMSRTSRSPILRWIASAALVLNGSVLGYATGYFGGMWFHEVPVWYAVNIGYVVLLLLLMKVYDLPGKLWVFQIANGCLWLLFDRGVWHTTDIWIIANIVGFLVTAIAGGYVSLRIRSSHISGGVASKHNLGRLIGILIPIPLVLLVLGWTGWWLDCGRHVVDSLDTSTRGKEAISFSPDSSALAVAYSSKIGMWYVKDGDFITRYDTRHYYDNFEHVEFIDDDALAIAMWDGTVWGDAMVYTLDASNGDLQTEDSVIIAGRPNCFAVSPDGALVATGSRQGVIQIWRIPGLVLVNTINGQSNWKGSLAFSPDNAILAAGSDGGTIRLWSVSDGTQIQTLDRHADDVHCVAFSPDGTLLASGSRDGTVRLWRVADWEHTQVLRGHTKDVSDVVFSADGSLLVSASSDKTVRIWDLEDGEQIKRLWGFLDGVMVLEASPDGRLLASLTSDGRQVQLWDMKQLSQR